MARYRFVIADDHPLFRNALAQTVASVETDVEISHAGNFSDTVKIVTETDDIDLLLLDLKMPGAQGFSGLVYMRAQFPNIPVVVVSASEETAVIRRAIELGASGFIPKSSSSADMKNAVQSVLNGSLWVPDGLDLANGEPSEQSDLAQRLTTLTPQQVRVLMLLREGLLNKQIAYELSVSEATIKAHVSAILQKLNVDSRTQAVIAAASIDGEVR